MQPEQVDALAGELILTIKAALAPVIADVKALQGQIASADARWNDLGVLRERIAVLEATKAHAPDGSDDLRDRLLVLETKAATPAPVVSPDAAVDDLRDRIVTLETRSAGPSPADMAIVDLRERVTSLERRMVDDSVVKELGAIRERLAVVETRAPVPGPAGRDGATGANGKDGVDGVGFEDLAVEFDGDRTLALRFERGGVSKVFPITLPFLRYQDVFQEGKTYTEGDIVTWGGSTWHANETTKAKPGDGSKAWTLAVKRGRDGKDGRDALDPVPVVKVR